MSRPYHDDKYHKSDSRRWKPVKLRKLRRPLFIVVCCLLGFLLWHQSHSLSSKHVERVVPDQSPAEYEAQHENLGGIANPERRSTPETPVKHKHDHVKDRAAHQKAMDAKADRAVEVETPSKDSSSSGKKSAGSKSSHEDDEELSPKDKRRGKSASQQQALEEQPILPKGPVNVKAELDQQNEKEGVLSAPDVPAKEKVIEAEPVAHLSLEETGDSLPEVLFIPFEDVIKDMTLQGWEDEWIAHASFNKKWGKLEEPKIDFVYLWVNGSEEAFQTTKRPYEENSVLNDAEGKWISTHGVNRYRDWDELKYSIRSVEKFAANFRNKIQIVVNSVKGTEAGKQVPTWLNQDNNDVVQVLAQEEFFDDEKHVCLPTFNSLTIENQLFNTPSDTDLLYALSDDMLLGKKHAASDIHSPLFGPVMGFKTNAYNTVNPPTDADAQRFGEKPFLIYTSWLLNRRFGNRKRKGQGHFGHALSRTVMKEAVGSFPGPELQSACKRFRGEPGFQLYSWYITFHYLIERHREAMLWSFIMLRSDADQDGFLNWAERQRIISALDKGMENEGKTSYRKRNFYHLGQLSEHAGLESPRVNTDILWTSLDGPSTIINLDCSEFDVNECLAPGFSISSSDATSRNPMFSTALVFDRLTRQKPNCGDCLLKLLLNQVPRGLSPILPDAKSQPAQREMVVKALMRYRYTISNPDALFVMVTDAEQVDSTLTARYIRGKRELAGQLCLNDDVATEEAQELEDVKLAMTELYQGLFPEKSQHEL